MTCRYLYPQKITVRAKPPYLRPDYRSDPRYARRSATNNRIANMVVSSDGRNFGGNDIYMSRSCYHKILIFETSYHLSQICTLSCNYWYFCRAVFSCCRLGIENCGVRFVCLQKRGGEGRYWAKIYFLWLLWLSMYNIFYNRALSTSTTPLNSATISFERVRAYDVASFPATHSS